MTTQEQYRTVCANVRYLRKIHGLSRTAMAKKMHITLKTLDALESGVFPERIHVGFLQHLQESFGIGPYKMLTVRLECE